jgi:hypothetical protein
VLNGWNTRDDVAEELTETYGWLEDPQSPGVFTLGYAKWTVIAANGESVLTVTGTQAVPGYAINFVPTVPHFQIVRACIEATADCWRCGTACEGDCNEPDGVVFGRDGDGTVYSRTL